MEEVFNIATKFIKTPCKLNMKYMSCSFLFSCMHASDRHWQYLNNQIPCVFPVFPKILKFCVFHSGKMFYFSVLWVPCIFLIVLPSRLINPKVLPNLINKYKKSSSGSQTCMSHKFLKNSALFSCCVNTPISLNFRSMVGQEIMTFEIKDSI